MKRMRLTRVGCLIGRGQCTWVTDHGHEGDVHGYWVRQGEMTDWFWAAESPVRTYCVHCGRRK